MKLAYRNVNEADSQLILKWRNDPDTRKNSFSSDEISYDTHIKWFSKTIHSPDVLFFIAMKENQPIGQIRINIENGCGIINYSIAVENRNKGYGTQILLDIENLIRSHHSEIKCIKGYVKYENLGSKKAFERAGFSPSNKDDFIEYYKLIP